MKLQKYNLYKHHDEEKVFVREDLKGRHTEFCLCYNCERFKPGEKDNCVRANLLYAMCVALNMVTPVWECPDFSEKAKLLKLKRRCDKCNGTGTTRTPDNSNTTCFQCLGKKFISDD